MDLALPFPFQRGNDPLFVDDCRVEGQQGAATEDIGQDDGEVTMGNKLFPGEDKASHMRGSIVLSGFDGDSLPASSELY